MWALSLFSILFKYRKVIIINTLVVTVLALAVSFILPKRYSAKTTILPPESESGFGGIMGLSTGALAQAATNFALPLMATPSDLYASMIESENILGRVVDSLDLVNEYEASTKWAALTNLREALKVKVEPDGIVDVRVEAKSPELAADIANLMVRSLDQLKKEMRSQKGREFSQFLESRLAETEVSLKASANALRDFQETHGAIALDIQSETLIKNLAEVKSRLTVAEVELEIMRKQLHPQHPEIVRKGLEISELKSGLRRAETGTQGTPDSIISAFDVPLSRVPDLSLQLAALIRDVKIYEMTYELLSQQFEMAQLQERRDTPTVTVLDFARPVTDPVWPRKKWIVLAAFALTFLATSTLVVIIESLRTEQNPVADFVKQSRELWQQNKITRSEK